jgi:hypothetical protein
MIVHDHPSIPFTSPDEAEVASDRFVSLQLPLAEHESGVISQRLRFQMAEGKFTHCFLVGVASFVAVASCIPTSLRLTT